MEYVLLTLILVIQLGSLVLLSFIFGAKRTKEQDGPWGALADTVVGAMKKEREHGEA